MAKVELKGTTFAFSILPFNSEFAKTKIVVENEFISYQNESENFLRGDIENWIYAMFRLLAGGNGKELSLSFEKTGFVVDLCPYMENGQEVTREERRKQECAMAIHFLMKKEKTFLDGIYSITLYRAQIEEFAKALQAEYYAAFSKFEKKKGKYLCVGVSPQGYKGCNYWYVDETKTTKAGDYVWVCMGRHNTRQIVYVDSVRYYDEDTTPCKPSGGRIVLKKATTEEVAKWKKELLQMGRKI